MQPPSSHRRLGPAILTTVLVLAVLAVGLFVFSLLIAAFIVMALALPISVLWLRRNYPGVIRIHVYSSREGNAVSVIVAEACPWTGCQGGRARLSTSHVYQFLESRSRILRSIFWRWIEPQLDDRGPDPGTGHHRN